MTDISVILAHEEIGMVWEKLPAYIQTRTPKLIYRASEEGFDLASTYFEKVKPFEKDKSKACLLFIRTTEDENFGLYLDDILRLCMRGYAGQFENFLFSSVRAAFHVYKPTSINPKDFKSQERLFEVGPSKALALKESKSALCPTICLIRK